MWRVAWQRGQATEFSDHPTEQQAKTYEANIRNARGAAAGQEITYPVWVWTS